MRGGGCVLIISVGDVFVSSVKDCMFVTVCVVCVADCCVGVMFCHKS